MTVQEEKQSLTPLPTMVEVEQNEAWSQEISNLTWKASRLEMCHTDKFSSYARKDMDDTYQTGALRGVNQITHVQLLVHRQTTNNDSVLARPHIT